MPSPQREAPARRRGDESHALTVADELEGFARGRVAKKRHDVRAHCVAPAPSSLPLAPNPCSFRETGAGEKHRPRRRAWTMREVLGYCGGKEAEVLRQARVDLLVPIADRRPPVGLVFGD